MNALPRLPFYCWYGNVQFLPSKKDEYSRVWGLKNPPERAVVGKARANSGKSTIIGGSIALQAANLALKAAERIDSIFHSNIIPGQMATKKSID